MAIHEAWAVDLSTFTRKWADVFQHVDRNTALKSPLSHPRRLSINVKTNHSPFSLCDSRKNTSAAEFLEFCFHACNLRTCCNSIKTLNELNTLRGIWFMFLADDVADTWLCQICLGLWFFKVSFHNIDKFTSLQQLTAARHPLSVEADQVLTGWRKASLKNVLHLLRCYSKLCAHFVTTIWFVLGCERQKWRDWRMRLVNIDAAFTVYEAWTNVKTDGRCQTARHFTKMHRFNL